MGIILTAIFFEVIGITREKADRTRPYTMFINQSIRCPIEDKRYIHEALPKEILHVLNISKWCYNNTAVSENHSGAKSDNPNGGSGTLGKHLPGAHKRSAPTISSIWSRKIEPKNSSSKSDVVVTYRMNICDRSFINVVLVGQTHSASHYYTVTHERIDVVILPKMCRAQYTAENMR